MTVNLAPEFCPVAGRLQVVLTTEERIYRINWPLAPPAWCSPTCCSTRRRRRWPSPGNVIASNTQGGTLNKWPGHLAYANPTAVVGGVTTTLSPTANITNVQVGACTFTIGGTVSYSAPVDGGSPGPRQPPRRASAERAISARTRARGIQRRLGLDLHAQRGRDPVQIRQQPQRHLLHRGARASRRHALRGGHPHGGAVFADAHLEPDQYHHPVGAMLETARCRPGAARRLPAHDHQLAEQRFGAAADGHLRCLQLREAEHRQQQRDLAVRERHVHLRHACQLQPGRAWVLRLRPERRRCASR